MSYVEYENMMYGMEEMMEELADWEVFEEDMRQQSPECPTLEEMEEMWKALG